MFVFQEEAERMGKRGPKPGTGGRPVLYPERLSVVKLPSGAMERIKHRAESEGHKTVAAYVRSLLEEE
tara:strand:+ start:232 stop:435 length:204 start_codon:yes stop_codon:yes gene_type:complete